MTDHVLERELVQQAAALRRMARALVGPADADDLVQDAALHLLRTRPRRPAQLGGLFATVLRQLASKLRRGAGRRARRERAAARDEALPAADHGVAHHETVAAVLRELLALPSAYRDALLQRFFEERTPAQIAAHQGAPVETVKTRLKRGLAMLRERLDHAALPGDAGRPGSWRTALVGLCGLGHGGEVLPFATAAATTSTTGAIVMTMGTKWMLGSFLAAAAAAVWWFAGATPREPAPPDAMGGRLATAAAADATPPAPPSPDVGERSELARTAPAAATAPASADDATPTTEEFLQRLNGVWPLDGAVAIARELGALPAPRVLAILDAIWARIENAEVRRLILGPLVKAHPQLGTALLHFGAEDRDAEVRGFALAALSRYALLDFAADPSRYATWRLVHGAATAGEAMTASAFEHVERLRSQRGAELAAALALVDHRTLALATTLGVDLAQLFERAGMGELLDPLLGSADPAVARAAWQAVSWSGASDDLLQRRAMPLLQAPDELAPEVRNAVFKALGTSRGAWVPDAIVASMLATTRSTGPGCYFAAAMALAEHGDPGVIPTLIGMIEADGSYETVYGIGYFALGKLTGVPYDESHDGAWWRRWWNENQHRLPPAARGRTIPVLHLR